MRSSLNIAIACLMGSLVGSILALELGSFMWWIGAFVGGFIGYISYEFEKVIDVIKFVVYSAISDFRKRRKMSRQKSRKTLVEKTLIRLIQRENFIGSYVFSSGVTGLMYGISWVPALTSEKGMPTTTWTIGSIMFSCFVGIFLGIFLFKTSMNDDRRKYEVAFWKYPNGYTMVGNKAIIHCRKKLIEESRPEKRSLLWFEILRWSPVFLPVSLLFLLGGWFIYVIGEISPSIIWNRVVSGIIHFANSSLRLCKKIFFLIHDDVRLLCFTDSMLGACVGYFAGSAIIGAVAGAIFGVINYQIVSLRLLKLLPR